EGQALLFSIEREISEKHLKKFFENPRNINKRELDKTIRELEAVLPKSQIDAIRKSFEDAPKRFPGKARVIKFPEEINSKVIEKYTGHKSEKIDQMMNTRSGIIEIRQDLSKTDATKEAFNTLAKEKVTQILQEGKVVSNPTGQELYNILNQMKNRELLLELVGQEALDAEFEALRQIANKKVNKDMMIKIIKKGALIDKLGAVGLLL
ncbi:MAG: hypothetical protein AABY22_22535, partial [Nanoarchaeota archaeon]